MKTTLLILAIILEKLHMRTPHNLNKLKGRNYEKVITSIY